VGYLEKIPRKIIEAIYPNTGVPENRKFFLDLFLAREILRYFWEWFCWIGTHPKLFILAPQGGLLGKDE